MTGSNFRSNLFSKKRSDCFNYIDSNLYGKKLILAIQDLIFLSVSIETKNEIPSAEKVNITFLDIVERLLKGFSTKRQQTHR